MSWLEVSSGKALLRQLKGWTPVRRLQEGIRCPFTLVGPAVQLVEQEDFSRPPGLEGDRMLILDSRL